MIFADTGEVLNLEDIPIEAQLPPLPRHFTTQHMTVLLGAATHMSTNTSARAKSSLLVITIAFG